MATEFIILITVYLCMYIVQPQPPQRMPEVPQRVIPLPFAVIDDDLSVATEDGMQIIVLFYCAQ